jgi:hypothetical protein
LTININENIPNEYSVKVNSPDGVNIDFQCIEGEEYPKPNSQYRPICDHTYGFTLSNFSPEVLNISIEWGNNTYSNTFRPDYDLFYPTRPECPPGCKVGKIVIDLPNN